MSESTKCDASLLLWKSKSEQHPNSGGHSNLGGWMGFGKDVRISSEQKICTPRNTLLIPSSPSHSY